MNKLIVNKRPIISRITKDQSKHPLKITSYPAYRIIHTRFGGQIIGMKEMIPGTRQYVLWFTDGSFVGLGAEIDELQPN